LGVFVGIVDLQIIGAGKEDALKERVKGSVETSDINVAGRLFLHFG
jgi:hypothetical protein